MALVLCCWRADPVSSSAALVAAWLIDALAGVDGVRLRCANAERVMLDVAGPNLQAIRDVLDRTLAEPRFAGWQVLE
jgi:hypothetical protein